MMKKLLIACLVIGLSACSEKKPRLVAGKSAAMKVLVDNCRVATHLVFTNPSRDSVALKQSKLDFFVNDIPFGQVIGGKIDQEIVSDSFGVILFSSFDPSKVITEDQSELLGILWGEGKSVVIDLKGTLQVEEKTSKKLLELPVDYKANLLLKNKPGMR